MNDFMRWLLSLDRLQWGAENVRFGFERPLPAWGWAGVVAIALGFAVWSYSRLTGGAAARGALSALRAMILIAIGVLIAGPELVQRDETVERDWVLVLVDRSASMTIEDAAGDAGGARVTRELQLERAIQKSWPMWTALREQRTVVWMGFDAGAYDLKGADTGALDLGRPTGRRTSLASAVDQALRRAAARPLSGVVILSDGRSLDEPGRGALRRLQAERVPVHVVPLGSDQPVGDLAIRRAEGPGMAFVNDIAPVTVDIERLGAAGGAGGVVRLTDTRTGLVLDERPIDPAAPTQTVTLTTRPQDPGVTTWKVEIVPAGTDLIAGNNAAEVQIELVDRPLRVLYVDGYPRWEERYLKNLFIREKSITSSNLLLAPSRKSSQEGDVEIDALPDSPDRWGEYDVVVLGDVLPDVFTRKQLTDLREHVSGRGGGLLWIGGPGATPEAWWGTPLGDLIPFTREGARAGTSIVPCLVRPTALAEKLGVLRLGPSPDDPWPRELGDAATGWSLIHWRQAIDPAGLKPTTEILALAAPVDEGPEGSAATGRRGAAGTTPLVMSMRYGAGRVLYVATDEIWRWRYGRGEQLFERFWLQLVRLLGRESLSRSGKSATIAVEPRRATVEQPVRVSMELLDQALAELGMGSIAVRLTRRPAPGDPADAPTAPVEITLRPESPGGRVFSATWLPTEAGDWTATPLDTALAGLQLSAEVIVSQPDDELRRPETDHALLARLSEETGGKVLPPDSLSTLPAELPNRQERLVSEQTEPLWDTPLALIIVIGLLTVEWIGRRLLRLI